LTSFKNKKLSIKKIGVTVILLSSSVMHFSTAAKLLFTTTASASGFLQVSKTNSIFRVSEKRSVSNFPFVSAHPSTSNHNSFLDLRHLGRSTSAATRSFISKMSKIDTASNPKTRIIPLDKINDKDDPYLYLEEVESETSLDFAKAANDACLKALGDPKTSGTGTYEKVLEVLESDDRIPYTRKYGSNDDGDDILFNLWKDAKNPKGLWRKTTLSSYRTPTPEWTTVLDVDELAKSDDISWVWKGSIPLPRSRDPLSNNTQQNTRTLLQLSRGGADAVHIKEFDLLKEEFVKEEDGGFTLPEAKTRVSYKSRDVLWVGSDFGPGSLTDSGYPRVIKEWIRGTKLEDAKVIYEGEKTDVSVYNYVSDQRRRNGPIYEVQGRSITFYTSKYEARKVTYEQLLAPNDPLREGVSEPGPYIELDIQEDAEIDFIGKLLIVSLRSDWEPVLGEKKYKSGSVIYTDADTFLEKGKEACNYQALFEPTERSALETYSCTLNYLIMSIMDNVKSKLEFYKIENDGSELRLVGGDASAKIRAASAGPCDSYTNDEFWFTTSGYTQPTTLYLADAQKAEEADTDEQYITEKIKALPPKFDTTGLVVEQQVAVSEDGTEIPYFMVRREDTVLDGNNPTLLYGYGGFEISMGPKYIASVGNTWLEKGGVYVEACIRGGGEFGPSWHQAALKAKRNKSYEDFIGVAEHLISTNLCRPATLAIRGGSNGGLLMGNMYTMRPDLFGAVHCAVPLLDMKRFHTLLAGASWMAEYGDPDTDDWKNFLYKYSSYHQIDDDVEKYPPILFTTSTRDDRVHPAHARKMVKKLWDMGKGKDWPVYYYENIEGGHGGAADAKQSAFMTSLSYDFMWDTLYKGKTN